MSGLPERVMSDDVPNVSLSILTGQKRCTKCGEIKPLNEFYKRSDVINGYQSLCKECEKERTKKWHTANSKKEKERSQKWYKENSEKSKEYTRLWRAKNPEKARKTRQKRYQKWRAENPEGVEKGKKYSQNWAAENPEKIKENNRRWYKENPEKARENARKWAAANPGKIKEKLRRSSKKSYSTLKGKLNKMIQRGMLYSLIKGSKAGRHWENLVPYTIDDLKRHLEKRFTKGMSWENYGKWHLDHKVPISVFNFKTPEDIDFHRCWALENLQPLWAVENFKKNNKLDRPFQPSLAFTMPVKRP